MAFQGDVHPSGEGSPDAHAGEAIGELDLDGRLRGGTEGEQALLPESDGLLVGGGDGRVVDGGRVVGAPDHPRALHVRPRARFDVEIAPLFRADAVGRVERDLAREVDGDELARQVERLPGQAKDDARHLGRRQAEGLVGGEGDPPAARRAQQPRSRVPQLAGRNEEHGGAGELLGEVEIDVAGHAVDGAAARPHEGKRAGKEGRVGEGDGRGSLLRDPEGREGVERRAGAARRGGGEDDGRSHRRRPEIEQPLEALGEDAPVHAHGLEGQRRLHPERVERLLGRAAVACVLQHASVTRAELRAILRASGNLARLEELALAGPAHDDGEKAGGRRVAPVAVRAADVRLRIGKRAGGDLDAHPFGGGCQPRREGAVEAHLGFGREADGGGTLRGLGGALVVEKGPAQRPTARQIDGEDGHVHARSEGLRAARAVALQGAVAVPDTKLDLVRLAAVRDVAPQRRAHRAAGTAQQERGAKVDQPAAQGRVERSAAHQPAQKDAVEDCEPGAVRRGAHGA